MKGINSTRRNNNYTYTQCWSTQLCKADIIRFKRRDRLYYNNTWDFSTPFSSMDRSFRQKNPQRNIGIKPYCIPNGPDRHL